MNLKRFLAFIVIFFVVAFFTSIISVQALTGTINGDEVGFRKTAGTGNNLLMRLNKGTIVTVKNAYAVQGSGCSAGWIHISYNNKDGYVCKTYIDIAGMESYGRPWTSPKKAIFGGAEFISSGYISAGQFTSYLKKFNVNSNSSSGVYKHQYMANLAAPYNEAKTTYNSYKQNGLLSLPLLFTIPIFNNMPEYTAHPLTGKEVGGTSTVTDKEFEKKLDSEGFPETYKTWLRELHKSYPNWTFKSMKTGLDFYTSVEEEKWISSIQKTNCAKCIDPANINTEGNWYVGSTEVTAYFLDPRNFLMADSILMFENLSFSENYKENVVQSVLAGTFMSGKDHVDNLTYSSMFMEAGKNYNVNPVYLAALAKQEIGVTSGTATSGNRFEYNGNTYEGFYNFFNIGAYSSEASPVKAGLVYAAAGSSKNAQGVFVGNVGVSTPVSGGGNNGNSSSSSNNNKPTVTPLATHLSNMKLNKKGNYITNIAVGTTVGTLKSRTKGTELAFRNSSGSLLGDSEKITTGTKITFPTGETYEVVIYGDLTGDGKVDLVDLQKLKMYLLGKESLDAKSIEAAKAYNKNSDYPNLVDWQRIKFYILGKNGISQS